MSFIGNEPEDRMWVYTFAFLILIVIVATTLLIYLVNEDIKANNICSDNSWDRAVLQTSSLMTNKYVCQNIIKDKWTTHTVNSTDAFEVNKYKANPGEIE